MSLMFARGLFIYFFCISLTSLGMGRTIIVRNRPPLHVKSRLKDTSFIQGELQPALNTYVSSESVYFIEKAFPLCPFTDSFRLKRLKFLLQMFSV